MLNVDFQSLLLENIFMRLAFIIALLSCGIAGVTYYFGGIWATWGWSWIWFPIVFALALYWFIFLFVCLTIALISEFQKQNGKATMEPNRFCQRVLGQLAFLAFVFFRAKVKLSGKGKINFKKSFLMVSNHVSNFDQLAIISRLRRANIACICKKQLFSGPMGGWIKACGYIPLDRKDMVSDAKMFELASEHLKEGKSSIIVAPEGTRNLDFPNPQLLPFHAAVFEVARNAKAPIVVTAIQNTNAISKRFPFRSTKIYIDIVGVIDYEQYKDLTNAEVSDKARNMILDRFEEKGARFYHISKKEENKEQQNNE